MVDILSLLAKDHSKWLRIVRSFGLTDTAEDLVQEMYIKVYEWKGRYDKTLMYNETEVNEYFIFKVLRGLFLDTVKKKKYEFRIGENSKEPVSHSTSYEFQEQLQVLKDEVKSWHVYDRKIYELIYLEGYSMLELSKQTGIEYYSIYRTKNKIEKLLNKKIQE